MFVQPKQLAGRKPIIQIRAGRMIQEGKMVKPDTKKGVFTLVNDASGMVEILWSNLTNSTETVSALVAPGEATFNKVTKCTTGRVFVLDFKGTRQMFWWLQENSEERDEEFLKAVKKALGDGKGDKPKSGGSGSDSGSGTQALDMNTLRGILSGLTGQAGQGGAAPPAGTAGKTVAPAAGPSASLPPTNDVDLQDLLASQEVLAALNEDPAFYMTQLHEFLPPDTDPSSNIVDHVRNPQVSATAALLQAALSQADGYREIVTAFGLGQARGIGADAFLRQIEEEAKAKQTKDSGDKSGSGPGPAPSAE